MFQEEILSFTWIPVDNDTIMMLSKEGKVEKTVIHKPACLSWSCRNELLMNADLGSFTDVNEDITVKMFNRAKLGYSLDINTNLGLRLGAPLHQAWLWLYNAEELSKIPFFDRHMGVLSVLEKPKAALARSGLSSGVSTAAMSYTAAINSTTSFKPRESDSSLERNFYGELKKYSLSLCKNDEV